MNYSSFLKSVTKDKWKKVGIKKRTGIAIPLFSIYSKKSTGIGEIPDLKLLIDWCKKNGFSIIQLLPIYDTGYDFAPYSSISSFALDPMYLQINKLKEVDLLPYNQAIINLKKRFHTKTKYVNYEIKKAKLDLLWEIFNSVRTNEIKSLSFFKNQNKYWLNDYAVFKVLSEKYGTTCWENWDNSDKYYNNNHVKNIISNNRAKIDFYIWLQWQLSEQLKALKIYAEERDIFIMGDIPFLASRNSSDVWAHQEYFKLDKTAGAPPDMFFAYGQKWGMPLYNWKNVAIDNYKYLHEKLKYAENFFDMYRIDHFVGLFRIWTVDINAPSDEVAIKGKFDPEEIEKWDGHGKKIINKMLKASAMLPCAEDLGTVPECSYKTLKEYSIPGIDFQRFMKNNHNFIRPESYRNNSISVLSTHDLSFFINWWDYEADGIDETVFNLICKSNQITPVKISELKNKLFDKSKSGHGRLYWKDKIPEKDINKLFESKPKAKTEIMKLFLDSYNEKEKFLKFLGIKNRISFKKTDLVKKCLEKISESNSIFSIQFLQEYLCLDTDLLKKINKRNYRINIPGTCDKKNWSVRLPIPMEKLKKLKINKTIYKLNSDSGRVN